jgi:hypothetical protein
MKTRSAAYTGYQNIEMSCRRTVARTTLTLRMKVVHRCRSTTARGGSRPTLKSSRSHGNNVHWKGHQVAQRKASKERPAKCKQAEKGSRRMENPKLKE